MPQFKLTVAGASIHISSAVLRYVEIVHFLSVLKESNADETEKADYEALDTHSEEDSSKSNFDLLLWLKSCNMEVRSDFIEQNKIILCNLQVNISPIVVAISTDSLSLNGTITLLLYYCVVRIIEIV